MAGQEQPAKNKKNFSKLNAAAVALFSAPSLVFFWLVKRTDSMEREAAGAMAMILGIGVLPLVLCCGVIALVLTIMEWGRYRSRSAAGNPGSAIPVIAVSLLNLPFFWLCISCLTAL